MNRALHKFSIKILYLQPKLLQSAQSKGAEKHPASKKDQSVQLWKPSLFHRPKNFSLENDRKNLMEKKVYSSHAPHKNNAKVIDNNIWR